MPEQEKISTEHSQKPWLNPKYKAKQLYDAMRHEFYHCWACHASRKPREYYGPWMIERAHIVNKPRREDRRAVVMLCTICHKFSHGENIYLFERPKLSVDDMVRIKIENDSEWFDLAFLQSCSVRIVRMPETLELPAEIVTLRESTRTRC